jgi:hypothetical protein
MITPREPSQKEMYEKNYMQPPPPKKRPRGIPSSEGETQQPLTARSKGDLHSYCPPERKSKNKLFGNDCCSDGDAVVVESGIFLSKTQSHVSGSRCDISMYEDHDCLVLVAVSPRGKSYRLCVGDEDLPKICRIKQMDSIEKVVLCQDISRKLEFKVGSTGRLELTAKFVKRNVQKEALNKDGRNRMLGELPALSAGSAAMLPGAGAKEGANDSASKSSSSAQRIWKAKAANKSVGLNNSGADPDVPKKFCCAITQRLMNDPVTANGSTFDRSSIESWFARQGQVCPFTHTALTRAELKSRLELKKEIASWHIRNAVGPGTQLTATEGAEADADAMYDF